MADLNHEQKTFVVRCLARFLTPSETADAVKDEFEGLVVSRQAVRYYNPEQSIDLAEEWRTLFLAERMRVVSETKEIGISHKSVRLRELDAMYRRAKAMKNFGLAKDILEQAAKEDGGVFTNRRHLEVDPRSALASLLGVEPDELPEATTDKP